MLCKRLHDCRKAFLCEICKAQHRYKEPAASYALNPRRKLAVFVKQGGEEIISRHNADYSHVSFPRKYRDYSQHEKPSC